MPGTDVYKRSREPTAGTRKSGNQYKGARSAEDVDGGCIVDNAYDNTDLILFYIGPYSF